MEVVRRRSNPTTSPAKYADAFYNCQDGDIILRSNDIDRVDFRTYKTFLIYASPLFKTMLSLPQSQSTDSQHEIPVVEMHENAEDLQVLLMFCHPGFTPDPPASLERLHRCYGIADKYMLDNVKAWLRTCLKEFVEKQPVGVYLLSRQYKWECGARLAAKQCLSRSLSDLVAFNAASPILEDVPAAFLRDLLGYHKRCSDFFGSLMDLDSWLWKEYHTIPNYPGPYDPSFEVDEGDCCTQPEDLDYYTTIYARSWQLIFISECREALFKVPCLEKLPRTRIFDKVAKEAWKCPTCGPSAVTNLTYFLDGSARTVHERLDENVRIPDGSKLIRRKGEIWI